MGESRPDVGDAVDLYGRGLSLVQVGQRLGVSPRTIAKRLQKAGVDRRPPSLPRTAATDEQLLELRATGMSFRKIGDQVGMTESGVWSRLRKFRPAGWTPKAPAELDVDRLVELYEGGMSVAQVAKAVGASSRWVVSTRLRTAGVMLRPGGYKTQPGVDNMILRLHAEGLTLQQIGEQIQMNPNSVSTRLQRLRRLGRLAPYPRVVVDIGRLADRYRAGLTTRQLSDQVGVSRQTVAQYLRDAGVPLRPPGTVSPVSEAQLLLWRADGVPGPQIAARLGVTTSAVYKRLRKARRDAVPDGESDPPPQG